LRPKSLSDPGTLRDTEARCGSDEQFVAQRFQTVRAIVEDV